MSPASSTERVALGKSLSGCSLRPVTADQVRPRLCSMNLWVGLLPLGPSASSSVKWGGSIRRDGPKGPLCSCRLGLSVHPLSDASLGWCPTMVTSPNLAPSSLPTSLQLMNARNTHTPGLGEGTPESAEVPLCDEPGPLHHSSTLILTKASRGGYHYAHCTDQRTESSVVRLLPRSQSCVVQTWGGVQVWPAPGLCPPLSPGNVPGSP